MEVVRKWIIGGVAMLMLAAPMDGRGAGLPDTISLDSLVNLYQQAPFNHAKHITLAKDCGVCHHHTTGTLVDDPNCIRCHQNSSGTKVVACRGCHVRDPFSVEHLKAKKANTSTYHLDKPGLKGAYHQSCMGCHTRMGGPVDCLSCHQRKKEGDAFYNSGEFAPKKGAETGKHH